MRRILIAAALTTGIAIVITSAVAGRAQNNSQLLRQHHSVMKQITFCEKGYEIASSFPSYASRKTSDPKVRAELIAQADKLTARQQALAELLATEIRTRAERAGIEPYMYDSLLNEYRTQAEYQAIRMFEAAENPNVVLNHLNIICDMHLTK